MTERRMERALETCERVLINVGNGKLGVGIRLRFMDKYHSEALGKLAGYSLKLEPDGCDAWAIDNEQGIYIVVAEPELIAKLEDLGPL